MKKRILSMLLAVVMVMAVIPASLIPVFAKDADGYANGYDVYISHDDPILDGQKDYMYGYSEQIVNTDNHLYKDNKEKNSFVAYSLITATGFYLYAEIKDSSINIALESNETENKGYTNVSSGDKFAIFMQLSNTIGGVTEWTYGYFDMDYAHDNVQFAADFDHNDVAKMKSSIITDGWAVEFFLPWENCSPKITKDITLSTVGVYFGLQANDSTMVYNINSGKYDVSHKAICYDNSECANYWHQGSKYEGERYDPVDGVPQKQMIHTNFIHTENIMGYHDGYDSAIVSPSQIEIDGELEDAYLESETIYNGRQFKAGVDFYAYTAVAQNGMYFWVRISDTSVDPEKESSSLYKSAKNGDKLQINLQIENTSKGQFAWGYFDLDYSSYPISKNCNFATDKCVPQKATKVVDGGWVAEVYIPWDSTSLVDTSDLSAISAYIGFQVNNYEYEFDNINKKDVHTNNGQAYDHPYGSAYYQSSFYGGKDKSRYTKVNFFNAGAKETESYGAIAPGFSVYSHSENIVIDAKRDEVYLKSDKISEKGVIGTDTGFDAYISATSKGIYIYNEIQDHTIGYEYMKYNTTSNKVGNHDKFQFYFHDATGKMNYFELDYYANNVSGDTYTQEEGLQELTHVHTSNVELAKTKYATKILRDKDGKAYGWVAEIFIPWDAATAFVDNISASQTAPYAMGVGLQVNNDTWTKADYDKTLGQSNIGANNLPADQRHYCYSNYSRTGWWTGGVNDKDRFFVPLVYTTYVAPTTSMYVTNEQIKLDGKLDEVYLNSQKILDRYQWSENLNGRKIDFTAYPVATSEGLYVWVETDDITMNNKIKDEKEKDAEKGDMIQLYLDWTEAYLSHEATGNSGDTYKLNDPLAYLGWYCFDYDGNIKGFNDVGTQKSGTKMSVVKYANPDWNGTDPKTQYIGYAIEAFIPWNDTVKNLIGAHRDDIHLGLGIQVTDDESYDGTDYRTSIAYCTSKGTSYFSNYEYLPNINLIYDENLPYFGNTLADKVGSVVLDGENTASEYNGASAVHVNVGGSGTADDGDMYRVVYTEDAVYILVESVDNTVNAEDNIQIGISFNGSYALAYKLDRGTEPKFSLVNYDTTKWFGDNKLTFKSGESIACSDSGDKWSYEIKLPLSAKDKEDMENGDFFLSVGVMITDGSNVKYSIANSDIVSGNSNNPSEIIKFIPVTFTETGNNTTTDLLGTSVTLSDSININYYASVAANDVANVKIKFTFNGKETWVGPKKTENDGIYIFPFEDIAPQCMGDNIKAELYVGDTLVESKDEYSILQNVINIMTSEAHPEYKTTYKDIVSALLKYGAAAQKYTNYKTGKLVTEYPDLSGLDLDFTNSAAQPSVSDMKLTGTGVTGAKFTAVGVYFANTNKIYVKIQTTAPETLSVKIDGMEAEIKPYDDLNNIYIVYSKDIKVTEFDKVFTFVLSDASGNTQTLTYSVNQYTANMWGSANAKTQELARATYDYGKAAKALKELKESM